MLLLRAVCEVEDGPLDAVCEVADVGLNPACEVDDVALDARDGFEVPDVRVGVVALLDFLRVPPRCRLSGTTFSDQSLISEDVSSSESTSFL